MFAFFTRCLLVNCIEIELWCHKKFSLNVLCTFKNFMKCSNSQKALTESYFFSIPLLLPLKSSKKRQRKTVQCGNYGFFLLLGKTFRENSLHSYSNTKYIDFTKFLRKNSESNISSISKLRNGGGPMFEDSLYVRRKKTS